MGRLITVTKDSSLVEEYDYDINGTRIYEMNTLRGIASRNFTYSDEDHLLTAGTTSYQYDVDGFLITKTEGADVTGYDYSLRGELLSATLPDGRIIEYVHDPLGRRIAKIVDGITVEKYLWQGLTRLLAVYDGSNSLIMRFEYADGRMPVAMTRGGATYYLTYDQVGSLRVVADGAGNVVKRIDYDSFGNIIGDTDPLFDMPFGFAGGLHDRDTGLVRFGYRDYDPDIGRWTAKDPILFAGGDTDLFGYCLNDPVNLIDPDGLMDETISKPKGFVGNAIDKAYTRANQFVNPSDWGPGQATQNFMDLASLATIPLGMAAESAAAACAISKPLTAGERALLAETDLMQSARGGAQITDTLSEALLKRGYSAKQRIKMLKPLKYKRKW